MNQELLSKLSDADLEALQSGDMSKLSDSALGAISGVPQPSAPQQTQEGFGTKVRNSLNAGLIAAGRGTDKIMSGLTQAYGAAIGDPAIARGLATQEAEKDRLYAPLTAQYPVATALGETAPALAIPMGGPASLVLKGAAAGAAPGLLSYGSPEERLGRGAVGAAGGALGSTAANIAARVLKPSGIGSTISQDALEAARRVGYVPTSGQLTQNMGMLNVENYLSRSPGSAGVMQRAADANQTAINTAGARAMGQSADNLSPSTFGAAQSAIGGEFNRLGHITQPDLGQGFLSTLANIDSQNAARGSFRSSNIDSLVNKGLDLAAQNKLSGTAYKEVRTEIANQANSAFKAGDATTGQALKSMRDALDDAAKGSLSKADQEAWDTARQQWGAFKSLSKSNVAEGGNLSAPRLAAEFRRGNPAFRTGGTSGELSDIARLGEAFKGVQNPNSGNLVQSMIYGNPLTGLPMLAGNRALAGAYMSPIGQRYLSQGLLDMGPNGLAASGRLTGLLGASGARSLLGVE